MIEINNKFKRKIYIISIIFIIITILLCVFMYGVKNISQQLYEERSFNLNNITEKIAQNMDIILSDRCNDLEYISKEFSSQNYTSFDVFIKNVAKREKIFENGKNNILAIDRKGICYTSTGENFRWENSSMLNEKSGVDLLNIPKLKKENTQLVFVLRLENSFYAGNTEITNMAISYDMNSLDTLFNLAEYGTESLTFIIKPNGSEIYKQDKKHSLNNVFNIFSALEMDSFLYDTSVEQMKTDIETHKSGCVFANHKGTSYFIAYRNLNVNGWYAVLFVPEDVVGKNSVEFMRNIIMYIGSISLIVLIIFVSTIIISSRRFAKKQKIINYHLKVAAEVEKQANLSKSDFLSRMSHDIRTPMNGIIGMINMAKQNINSPEKALENLDKGLRASNHLLSLINDILDMSKIEAEKLEIHNEKFNLNELLDTCYELIDGQLINRDIELIKEYSDLKYKVVYGDALHIRQVLINILGNSVNFTPDGGKIMLRVYQEELENQMVLITFEMEDTGVGISKEFISKIFDVFSQEEGVSRISCKGTGLGMAISKNLVELMGGKIDIQSEVNKGSLFTVKLKLKYSIEEDVAVENVSYQELAGMNVLLVEDNDLNMEIAQWLLEKKNINVTSAENGKIAFEIFRDSPPNSFDVILMDIMMPVMDGFEATKKIRNLERVDAKTIPIFAMTANAFTEDGKKAISSGMNIHLTKPINETELFNTLLKYYTKKGDQK